MPVRPCATQMVCSSGDSSAGCDRGAEATCICDCAAGCVSAPLTEGSVGCVNSGRGAAGVGCVADAGATACGATGACPRSGAFELTGAVVGGESSRVLASAPRRCCKLPIDMPIAPAARMPATMPPIKSALLLLTPKRRAALRQRRRGAVTAGWRNAGCQSAHRW